MVKAQQPPDLKIPESPNTVDVSIVNTTSYVGGLPIAAFMEPTVPGFDKMSAPCYGFSIKHHGQTKSKYDTLIFDLGIRKDWENGPKGMVERAKEMGYIIKTQKDVATILRENGQDLNEVGGIIWSHYHFDHTGDPSTFPGSTDLIVGPGFKGSYMPGYPTNPDAPVDEKAWEGRTLREIDFASEGKGLHLGKYPALDFYGDGSFYLLDTPGHAVGHMCGLARVTANPSTFILMGGDIAHHGGEFRPTQYMPLPDEIDPNPLVAPGTKNVPACPGHIFESIHPSKSRTDRYFKPSTAEFTFHADPEEAKHSLDKMTEFDGHDNIFPVIAHDESLYDVVDFYPKTANDWQAKGWKKEGQWRFLRDFDTGSTEHKAHWEPSVRKDQQAW